MKWLDTEEFIALYNKKCDPSLPSERVPNERWAHEVPLETEPFGDDEVLKDRIVALYATGIRVTEVAAIVHKNTMKCGQLLEARGLLRRPGNFKNGFYEKW